MPTQPQTRDIHQDTARRPAKQQLAPRNARPQLPKTSTNARPADHASTMQAKTTTVGAGERRRIPTTPSCAQTTALAVGRCCQTQTWHPHNNAQRTSTLTIFGHQAAVLSLAVARGRPVSGGADRTCRLWKVAEESQLIFRAPGQSVDAVCSVGGGGGEWASGGADGALCLWSPLKKRPAARVAAAHGPAAAARGGGSPRPSEDPVRGWIGAVAASRGGDLVASGAGDGSVRLWAARGVGGGGSSSQRSLEALGSIPAPGFVNGLAVSRDARVLVAGVGPEPRLGRWSRAPSARPALVVQRLRRRGEEEGEEEEEDEGEDDE